jgi:integrase
MWERMGERIMFTAKQLENLTAPGRHLDSDGLYLLIGKTGGKSWLMRYQIGGKRRDMGLGPYPAVTLKAARQAAAEARALIAKGIDPLAARAEAERASKAAAMTFEALALDYHTTHNGHMTDRRAKGWLSAMRREVFPVIGKMQPDQIGTEHILRILKPIWGTKPFSANELRGYLERLLDSARAAGLRTGENPARWRGHLDNLLSRADKKRASQVSHFPAMAYKELPAFMQELAAMQTRNANALQLVILTAARAGMVRFATWAEFDLQARVWSLPAERMKTRKAFTVPLSDQAIALLESLSRTGSPYLFPGTGRALAMGEVALFNLLEKMNRRDITVHGFRATFRTWASECTKYPREVCELSLAHDERDQTEAAYSRSNLLEQRRALMQEWGDYCTRTADNVVNMRARA